jgi:hypothetical protein
MNKNISFRWTWMALAVALACACLPAHAQAIWSSIDIDIYGNIAGASVTDLPLSADEVGYEAYVDALLNDLYGNEIMDVTASDNGEGYAEADTYGTALVSGDYTQWGTSSMYFLGWLFQVLGTTQADAEWAPFCPYPLASYEQFLQSAFVTPPPMSSNLTPCCGWFAGNPISESDGGNGYDGCYAAYPYGEDYNMVPDKSFNVGPANQYSDTNGYLPVAIDFYSGVGVFPCGSNLYQVMTMWCPTDPTNEDMAQIYAINNIQATILPGPAPYTSLAGGQWVSRAGHSGECDFVAPDVFTCQ